MKTPAALACGIALAYAGVAAPATAQTPAGLDKLSHILVLYLENRSFDNLFSAMASLGRDKRHFR